ncbi:jg8025 [Pararge aegeria aegeria]|uniref:Jg8025 protein n=1 Tax=Pararge aegeria aegeria TaxID=348720 RepID=A0A8S4RFZ7_9NEOP|nr:jg8025 [Pararge aegeria aegeria]
MDAYHFPEIVAPTDRGALHSAETWFSLEDYLGPTPIGPPTYNYLVTLVFDVTTSYNSMEPVARTKNMTYAALPPSEAFHSRLEVQARARNERQRGTVGLRVRHLSLSYLSERCVRVDSFYTIIHVFGKDEVL